MSCPILLEKLNDPSREAIKKHLKSIKKNNDEDSQPFNLYLYKDNFLHIPLWFSRKSFGRNNDDNIFSVNEANFTGLLYDKQEKYVEEAIELLETEGGALLQLRPGCGKTVMSLYISIQLKLLTLILIYNSAHYVQYYNSCNKFTTADIWCVGMEKEYPPAHSPDIVICLYTRVVQIPEEYLELVGLLIIDECDKFCNRTGIQSILNVTPKYVLCCTATYERDDDLHKVMDYVIGPGNRIKGELLQFDVHRVYTGIEGTRVKNNYYRNGRKGIDYTKLIQSLMYNDQRNYLIIRLCLRLVEEGDKIIVITAEKKHAKELCESTDEFFKRCNIPFTTDYMTGDKKTYEDCDILYVNYAMGGRGFDESSACSSWNGVRINTVVMACSFKSNTPLYQCIGRAFRHRSPQIYQLVDNDSTIKNHWYKNRRWYIDNGGVVHNYNMEWFYDL